MFRFNTGSDHRFGVMGICINISLCGLTLCGDRRSGISGIHRRHTTFLYCCWTGKLDFEKISTFDPLQYKNYTLVIHLDFQTLEACVYVYG